jgi:hypothetical protein
MELAKLRQTPQRITCIERAASSMVNIAGRPAASGAAFRGIFPGSLFRGFADIVLDTLCPDCPDRHACASDRRNCTQQVPKDDSGLVLRLRMNTAHWRTANLAVAGGGPLSISCQAGFASGDTDAPAFLIIDDLVLERVNHQWRALPLPLGWTIPIRPWQ